MLKWMIAEGYGDVRTITRRIGEMEDWLANPDLLEADADAEYTETIEIDLNEITEPILCCPNDPDDEKTLSDVLSAGEVDIDEVFIGSCMTNIGHFRAASKLFDEMGKPVPTRTWIVPPTKMDEAQLIVEGHYAVFGRAGARTEMPGCSLCMGNQARVAENSTVVSTSTRNFPNRLGDGADVYLASAELAAVSAVMGRLPSVAEYLDIAKNIDMVSEDIYKYLNFNELPKYQDVADEVKLAS
jgi:aconitate hydratase 2/2-methylisocitrate dehydratase